MHKIWLFSWFCALSALAFAACSGGDEFKEGTGGTKGSGGSGASAAATGDAAKDVTNPPNDAGKDTNAGEDTSAGGKANGTACDDGSSCASGHCVDGFCCNSDCAGECMSCKVLQKEGTCSPLAAGLDPDGECAKPDSGALSCEQVCNGAGACVSCGLYKCSSTGTTCINTCSGDIDCKSTAWCNGNTCELKKDNGKPCQDANECASNVCALGYCCNVACTAPSSCSTGQCLCNGTACTGDTKCINWYVDGDGDQFGIVSTPKVACENTPPVGYAKNTLDCYDQNPAAFPGATGWFVNARGDASYDYDCDGIETRQYPNVFGKTCSSCFASGPGGCITACSGVGFGCGCGISSAPDKGFKNDVPCGWSDKLYTCSDLNTDPLLCTPFEAFWSQNPKQGCR